jgi:glycosyltransferase involved in cell wall biosynthesis
MLSGSGSTLATDTGATGNLRILMLAPTPYFADRGCHVRIYEEARVARQLGHDVRLVTYHLGRDMAGIPTERIVTVPWYRKLTAGPSWHKPYLDVLLFFKALSVSRSLQPDLIHAHLHEGAFIGIFLKKILRIPLIFDCQGSLTGEITDHGFVRRGSLLASCFSAIERFINNRVDAIITSSTAGAEDLSGRWGVPAAKVTPLTDGVNTDEFSPGDKMAARRSLGLPADRPVVVFLGLLNRYQGVDLLLDVIHILKQRGVRSHFLLMGFPDEKYRHKADERDLAGMITFTGRVDYRQAPDYLVAGDLAVSPKISLTEANGKLFNYMACGLPCLVFDTPVNREILGDTGVYARFGDATDFADRLEGMLADPQGLEYLGGLARRKAVEEHSWRARGERLAALYGSVVASCS